MLRQRDLNPLLLNCMIPMMINAGAFAPMTESAAASVLISSCKSGPATVRMLFKPLRIDDRLEDLRTEWLKATDEATRLAISARLREPTFKSFPIFG